MITASAGVKRRRSKKSTLSLTCSVAEAEIQLDGRSVGRTPLRLKVKWGKHLVRVVAKGYASFEQSVFVKSGRPAKLHAQLLPVIKDGDALDLMPLLPVSEKTPSFEDLPHFELEPLKEPSLETIEAKGVLSLEALEAPLPALGPLPDLQMKVEPLAPWWRRWYVITGAGVVVAAVAIGVGVGLRKGKAPCRADFGWAPAAGLSPCPR